jgi:hypothetical protein
MAAGNDQVGPEAGEREGNLPADAAAAAGDQRHSTFEQVRRKSIERSGLHEIPGVRPRWPRYAIAAAAQSAACRA